MGNGLDLPPPPKKQNKDVSTRKLKKPVEQKTLAVGKFDNVAENDKVQFNKRVIRATADGFEMLAITTRRKVPQLLDEALELLREKYGKI